MTMTEPIYAFFIAVLLMTFGYYLGRMSRKKQTTNAKVITNLRY